MGRPSSTKDNDTEEVLPTVKGVEIIFNYGDSLLEQEPHYNPKQRRKRLREVEVVVQVLGIFRYCLDKTYESTVSEPGVAARFKEGYDIIISDGRKRVRLPVHPSNNHHIQQGRLSVLDMIQVDGLIFCRSAVDYVFLLESFQLITKTDYLMFRKRRKSILYHLTANMRLLKNTSGEEDKDKVARVVSHGSQNEHEKQQVIELTGADLVNDYYFSKPEAGGKKFYIPMTNEDCLSSSIFCTAPYTSLQGTVTQLLCQNEDTKKGITTGKMQAEMLRLQEGGELVDPLWKRELDDATDDETLQQEIMSLKYPCIMESMNASVTEMIRLERETNIFHDSTKLYNPVIGVVVSKTCCSHFGHSESGGSLPLKFSFQLQDHSHSVRVTCWNHVVRQYFEKIVPGQVVLIRIGRLKPENVHKLKRKRKENHSTSTEEFEIVLDTKRKSNENDKEGHILDIVKPEILPKSMQLALDPLLKRTDVLDSLITFDDVSRKAMDTIWLRNDYDNTPKVAVAGLITYCGKRELFRARHQQGFYEYRWIRVLDYKGRGEIVVQLFANGQFSTFLHLRAGNHILLTNLVLSSSFTSCTLEGNLETLARTTSKTEILVGPKFQSSFPLLFEKCTKNVSLEEQQSVETVFTPPLNVDPMLVPGEIISKNVSQEISYKGYKVPKISINYSPNLIGQELRFPSFDLLPDAKEGLDEFKKDMRVGETTYIRLAGTLSSFLIAKPSVDAVGSCCHGLVKVKDEKGNILTLSMMRDPCMGPIIDVSTNDEQEFKQYMESKLQNGSLGETKVTHVFVISIHRRGADTFDLELKMSLDPVWALGGSPTE